MTYFVPDVKKSGGEYKKASVNLKAIDEYKRELVFICGIRISVDMIRSIDRAVFERII